MKDINKDIENLEEIINLINKELDKKDKNVSAILDLKDLLSLRNLIKAYKELEEENIQLEACKDEVIRRYNFESIPVSLVEEKILEPMKKEHDKAIEGCIKRDIPQCVEDAGIAQELGYFIGKIEELLEKKD